MHATDSSFSASDLLHKFQWLSASTNDKKVFLNGCKKAKWSEYTWTLRRETEWSISVSCWQILKPVFFFFYWIQMWILIMCSFVARYNSSAATSTSSPSPLKSPTVTDRRRNESAWKKRRFRLLPSSAYRHFTFITTETASPPPPPPSLRTLQVEQTMALFSTVPPKNTHSHTTHSLSHTHIPDQSNSGVCDGRRAQGLWLPSLGDWLTWLSQWGAIVSYGNVLQSWEQEPSNTHTQTHIILLSCRSFISVAGISNTHTHTHTVSYSIMNVWYMPWGNAI